MKQMSIWRVEKAIALYTVFYIDLLYGPVLILVHTTKNITNTVWKMIWQQALEYQIQSQPTFTFLSDRVSEIVQKTKSHY